MAHLTRAGGARKRPVVYAAEAPSAPLRRARNAHRHGRFDEAAEAYREALSAKVDDLDAAVNLVHVYTLTGRVHDALRGFEAAARLAAQSPRALRDLGISCATLGFFDAAERCFTAALALDPGDLGAALGRLRCCLAAGLRAEAEAAIEALLRAAPDTAGAWFARYRLSVDAQAPDLDALARAAACEPDDGWVAALLTAARAEGPSPETAQLLDGRFDDAARWRARGARCWGTKPALLDAVCARALPGPWVELGVRYGVSTRQLAARAGERSLWALDSFEGLPEAWQAMPAGAFSMHGEVPPLPASVRVLKGWFDDTLGPLTAALEAPVSLLHIDSDLYQSAASGLAALGPWLTRGSLIVFDEYYGNPSWRDDEHRAFAEAQARFGWRAACVELSWLTGQAAFQLR
ncbi:MAG: class I SAM-dependent methyltransferase [Myxococcales bacterium]|nr:class I SAM-dependent methyltransferase [Myxococcales bacterium]